MEIVFVVCHACDGTIALENEKRKYLKIFIPLFLRRCIHRQSSCLSISSNFIWYTTYVCDFFSSSSPSCFAFFFFLWRSIFLRCQPVIVYGFTLRFPPSVSRILHRTYVHHHCLRSHFYTRNRWHGVLTVVCGVAIVAMPNIITHIFRTHFMCTKYGSACDRAHWLNIIMYYIIKCREFYDIFIYIYENRTS